MSVCMHAVACTTGVRNPCSHAEEKDRDRKRHIQHLTSASSRFSWERYTHGARPKGRLKEVLPLSSSSGVAALTERSFATAPQSMHGKEGKSGKGPATKRKCTEEGPHLWLYRMEEVLRNTCKRAYSNVRITRWH